MKTLLTIMLLLPGVCLGQVSFWFQGWQSKPDAKQAQAYFMLPGTNTVFTYTNNRVVINSGGTGGSMPTNFYATNLIGLLPGINIAFTTNASGFLTICNTLNVASMQTPWLTNIEGATHNLTNAGNITANNYYTTNGTFAVDSTGNMSLRGAPANAGNFTVGHSPGIQQNSLAILGNVQTPVVSSYPIESLILENVYSSGYGKIWLQDAVGNQSRIFLEHGGNVSIEKNLSLIAAGGGFYGNGIGISNAMGAAFYKGVVTLVNGVSVVSTTGADSTKTIQLTYYSLDGNGASVRYGSVVNGVSFTITSSNPTDANKVSWAILNP